MTLSARASQERQLTGAPVLSTAARASSAARQRGAQMHTTPARSPVAAFWPPGENAAATTGASWPPCSSSVRRLMSCRASSRPAGEPGLAPGPPVLLEGLLEPSEAANALLGGLREEAARLRGLLRCAGGAQESRE